MKEGNEVKQDWDTVTGAKSFLKRVKGAGITYKKLKAVLFGEIAIKVLIAVRKYGQKAYNAIRKYHEVWYMAKVAINKVLPHPLK